MSEVSWLAIRGLLHEWDRRGLRREELLAGSGIHPADTLQGAYVSWNAFCHVLDNMSVRLSDEELLAQGAHFSRGRAFSFLSLIARVTISPPDFMRWAYGATSPGRVLFSCVDSSCAVRSPNDLLITLAIRPGYRASRAFFTISQGTIVANLGLVGARRFRIEADIGDRRATFRVRYAMVQPWWPQIRLALGGKLMAALGVGDLALALQQLRQRYDDLSLERSRLQDRIDARTRDLAQARDDLAASFKAVEQAKLARDRVLSDINHEFRTPMAAIMLGVGQIRRDVGDASPQVLRSLEIVERAALRLRSLVDASMALAVGDEGRVVFPAEEVDVGGAKRSNGSSTT